jgi:hypothetical protein
MKNYEFLDFLIFNGISIKKNNVLAKKKLFSTSIPP